MPTAHVNGVRLNYLQSGPEAAGPEVEDLVMVHGLATNMAFWYFRYAPRFAKKYRVTLFDLRGHGHSEMPEAGYTPQDLGADVSALLDHLGIARAHFVAHSFGGVAVLNMACETPERVASLVLADTHIGAARHGSRHRWGHAGNIQAILDAHQIPLHTADPYFGYRLLTAVAHLQLNGQEVPAPLMELVSPLIGRYGKRTAAQWLKLMDTTRAEAELLGDDSLTLQRLRHLRFPILAMYGDQSQARLTGAELLEVWPHAEFRRVRDAGHFFPTTRPDEVIGACEKFWAGEYAMRPRHRVGDQKKSHFRSDRVYEHDGAWYCMTREQTRLGPFSSPELVSERLAQYIASVSSTEIAA